MPGDPRTAVEAIRKRPGMYVSDVDTGYGQFGDVRFTDRTAGSELFINPLMSLYFGFELAAVARRSLYLTQLEDTDTVWDVVARIEAFRGNQRAKPWRDFPH